MTTGRGAKFPRRFGEIKVYTLADPARGTKNFYFTVPAGKIWQPLSMHWILNTSATVNNRMWSIAAENVALGISYNRYGATATTAQAAGTRRRIIGAVNNGDLERVGYDSNGLLELFHVPLFDAKLPPTDLFYVDYVAGFDVNPATGDQISDIAIMVLEFSA